MKRPLPVFVPAIVLIFFFTQVFSQQVERDFGDVTPADFQLAKTDTAEAVILFDVGDLNVDATRGTVFKRHLRYVILKKSAFDSWGGNFKLYVPTGSFSRPQGFTCNLENGVVKKYELPESSVHVNKFDKEEDEVSVSFTNVKEGSIIEFQFFLRESDLYLIPWTFQREIPTQVSEFTIHAPVVGYVTNLRGRITPARHEIKADGRFQYWLMKDVPAFKPENLMPDKKAYISSVRFGTKFNTWSAIYADLLMAPDFWRRLEFIFFAKANVNEIVSGIVDSTAMVKAISSYVKSQINFSGTHGFRADELKDILERKYGSVGDINILLAAMLKKAGFKVDLVLLSTRDNGFVFDAFPSTSQFNYVVCHVMVNKKDLYLDATNKYLPFDMLPEECLNHKGFLVGKNQFGWVSIEPTHRDRIGIEANFTPGPEGALKGTVNFARQGYAAVKARQTYFQEGEENYFKKTLGTLWSIDQSKIENIKDIEKPVAESFELTLNDYFTMANDIMYINPHVFLREEFNPFTAEKREYPVDFGMLTDHVVQTSFIIPQGYELEKIPDNKVLVLPEGAARCTFNFTKTANKLTVMSRLQINKTLFYEDEYHNLKEFYARLISKKSEMIVLKKISGN